MPRTPSPQDDWPAERQGYAEARPQIAYANVPAESGPGRQRRGFSPTLEACIAYCVIGVGLGFFTRSIIAAGGFIDLSWSGIVSAALAVPNGPLEFAGIGALIWLHAKWRRATRLR